MKCCTQCGFLKPENHFRPARKRGRVELRAKCRSCEAEYYRSPEYRELANSKNRKYRAEGRRRSHDAVHQQNRIEKHPDKTKSAMVVRRALAAGGLSRPAACSRCGTEPPAMGDGRSGIQAHHEDYARPLDVIWLCHACHVAVHRARAALTTEEGLRDERGRPD